MDFQFDHLVHYMEDPHQAIADLKEEGIHAVEGGKHGNRPTFNVLTYFDLSYIEIIGTSDKQTLEQMNHPRHSMIETIIESGYKEGFVRFVVRTSDIQQAAEHFRSKGLTVNGPVPLSRKRPDGTLLEWNLLFIGKEDEDLQLPYIIQWNESDAERREDLTERGVIAPHDTEAEFSHVHFAVHDVNQVIKDWSEWLDLPEIGEAYVDDKLQATCRTLGLPGGNLVFCEPIREGLVSSILKERGEKPFQMNFKGNIAEDFEISGGRYHLEEK